MNSPSLEYELIVIIEIIRKVKKKITSQSDVSWTRYDSPRQLVDEIELHLGNLLKGELESLDYFRSQFLPTSTFQEHSIGNGWSNEYMHLAEKFDTTFARVKKIAST